VASSTGVIVVGYLGGPMVRGGGGQADPALFLTHVSLVANDALLLPGVGVGPGERAHHGCAWPGGAASHAMVEIKL
jgi:hypothetical protein